MKLHHTAWARVWANTHRKILRWMQTRRYNSSHCALRHLLSKNIVWYFMCFLSRNPESLKYACRVLMVFTPATECAHVHVQCVCVWCRFDEIVWIHVCSLLSNNSAARACDAVWWQRQRWTLHHSFNPVRCTATQIPKKLPLVYEICFFGARVYPF